MKQNLKAEESCFAATLLSGVAQQVKPLHEFAEHSCWNGELIWWLSSPQARSRLFVLKLLLISLKL